MECEQHFEELVRMDADAPACPHCGGLNARRQLSVFAVHGASSQPSYGQTAAGGGGRGRCGAAPGGGGGGFWGGGGGGELGVLRKTRGGGGSPALATSREV